MVNQSLYFQPAIDAISVEFPAGLIDAGETPAEATLRELREETGFGNPEDAGTTIEELSISTADSPGKLKIYQPLISILLSSPCPYFVRLGKIGGPTKEIEEQT